MFFQSPPGLSRLFWIATATEVREQITWRWVYIDVKHIVLIWRPSFALQTNEWSIRWQNLISTCAVHIYTYIYVTDFPVVKVVVTYFPVVNIHVDELSSTRIWQHKLCATLSANVNIDYCLPIKVYYRICTVRHIRIRHGRILVNFIPR